MNGHQAVEAVRAVLKEYGVQNIISGTTLDKILVALRAYDTSGGQAQWDSLVPQPPTDPVKPPVKPPGPILPDVAYPSGDALLRILATLNWDWGNTNNAMKLDGFALCGCPVDRPCNQWNLMVNATQEPNDLSVAARGLQRGLTLEQINAQLKPEGREVAAADFARVALVMKHYGLLA